MDPELFITVVWFIVQCFLLISLADLAGGVIHWAEDTFGTSKTPVWGPWVVAPNEVHHEKPAEIMKKHWLNSNAIVFSIVTITTILVVLFDAMSWQFAVFAMFGAMNQQVHRYAHSKRVDLPRSILFLQKIKFFQGARHHWGHHTAPHNSAYCVLTPWVNPLLDGIGFWRGLERVLVPVLGAPRREDLAKYGWYHG